MNKLSDGKERERMVQLVVTAKTLLDSVSRNELYAMLIKQFPNVKTYSMNFIIDDADYIIGKKKRRNNV